MNYQNGSLTASTNKAYEAVETPKCLPVLELFYQSIDSQNKQAYDLIFSIQDKLHKVLDRRDLKGNNVGTVDRETNPSDLTQSLSSQIAAMCDNNYRLQRIVDHLSEII